MTVVLVYLFINFWFGILPKAKLAPFIFECTFNIFHSSFYDDDDEDYDDDDNEYIIFVFL